jgi:hypothetical protein
VLALGVAVTDVDAYLFGFEGNCVAMMVTESSVDRTRGARLAAGRSLRRP